MFFSFFFPFFSDNDTLEFEDEHDGEKLPPTRKREKEGEREEEERKKGDDEEMLEELLEKRRRGMMRSSQMEDGVYYCLDGEGNVVVADDVLDGAYWKNMGKKRGEGGEGGEEEGEGEGERGDKDWEENEENEENEESEVKQGVGVEDFLDGSYWTNRGRRERREKERRERERREGGGGRGGLVCLDANGVVVESDSVFDGVKWVGGGGKGKKGLAMDQIRRAREGMRKKFLWEMEESDEEGMGEEGEMDIFFSKAREGGGEIGWEKDGRQGRERGRRETAAMGKGGGGWGDKRRKFIAPNMLNSNHLTTQKRAQESRKRDQALLASSFFSPSSSSSSSSSSPFSSSPSPSSFSSSSPFSSSSSSVYSVSNSPPEKKRRINFHDKKASPISRPHSQSHQPLSSHSISSFFPPLFTPDECCLNFKMKEHPPTALYLNPSLLLPVPFSPSSLPILRSPFEKRVSLGDKESWQGGGGVDQLWKDFLVAFEDYSCENSQNSKEEQLFDTINNLVQNFKHHPFLSVSAPHLCQTPLLSGSPPRSTFSFLLKIRLFILQILSNLPTTTAFQLEKWVELVSICGRCLFEDLIDLIGNHPSLLRKGTSLCGDSRVLMMWFFVISCLQVCFGYYCSSYCCYYCCCCCFYHSQENINH